MVAGAAVVPGSGPAVSAAAVHAIDAGLEALDDLVVGVDAQVGALLVLVEVVFLTDLGRHRQHGGWRWRRGWGRRRGRRWRRRRRRNCHLHLSQRGSR